MRIRIRLIRMLIRILIFSKRIRILASKFQIKGQNLANAQIGSYSIQFCCQLQASADPDALWMRIRVPKMMRIQSNLDTDPQHWPRVHLVMYSRLNDFDLFWENQMPRTHRCMHNWFLRDIDTCTKYVFRFFMPSRSRLTKNHNKLYFANYGFQPAGVKLFYHTMQFCHLCEFKAK